MEEAFEGIFIPHLKEQYSSKIEEICFEQYKAKINKVESELRFLISKGIKIKEIKKFGGPKDTVLTYKVSQHDNRKMKMLGYSRFKKTEFLFVSKNEL